MLIPVREAYYSKGLPRLFGTTLASINVILGLVKLKLRLLKATCFFDY